MSIGTITNIVKLLERDTAVLTTTFENVSDNPERTEKQVLVLVKHCEYIMGSMQDRYRYLNSLSFKCRSVEEHGEIHELEMRLRDIDAKLGSIRYEGKNCRKMGEGAVK